ncbi:MAG: serine protease, partial [Cyanobacteriota bacterium ELA615]
MNTKLILSLLLLSGVIKANLSYGFNDHKQNTIIAQSSASTDSTLLISQKKVTVRIITEGNSGSGVIIGKRNNTYLILTALHVIQARQNIQVQTDDGEIHSAKAIPNSLAKDKDLALLEFTTNKTYAIAKIAKQISLGSGLDTGIELSATGYPSQSKEFSSIEVTIQQLPKASLKEGYQLPYSGEIAQGMSGGPVFLDDELVAINGRTAFPIFNNYDYEDGSKPSKNEIEQMRKANWGIPINTALAYVKPEILTSYGLPLPAANTAIATAPLQGWLGTLEAKAKGFTVRIDSSSETNGSGVIIAKDGNTYTVLTAAHVVCQKTSTNQNCANLSYQILAPDGKKYEVNPNSIIQEEGVDLAVVKFQSEQKYDVATLVNYNPNESDFVFVAGFPKIKGQINSQWLFSGGKALEKQQGLASIRQDSNNNLKIAEVVGLNDKTVKSTSSLAGGYELVYTSITYGGMSGGPVLDSAGRVIGIHGQAEGANVLIHEGSSLVSNTVQLGYSLGIPASTLMNLSERLKLNRQLLSLGDSKAPALSQQQITDINKSILKVEVPKTNAPAEVWLERGNQLWRLGKYQEADKA